MSHQFHNFFNTFFLKIHYLSLTYALKTLKIFKRIYIFRDISKEINLFCIANICNFVLNIIYIILYYVYFLQFCILEFFKSIWYSALYSILLAQFWIIMQLCINLLQLRKRDVDLSLNENVDDFSLTMCISIVTTMQNIKRILQIYFKIFLCLTDSTNIEARYIFSYFLFNLPLQLLDFTIYKKYECVDVANNYAIENKNSTI